MSKERISIQDLIDLMVDDRNFTKRAAEDFIRVLLETIEEALQDGESVRVKGLGTFRPQWNEARRSIDVNSGEEILIPGFYRAVFTPENELKELINEPYAHLEPIPLEDEEEDVGIERFEDQEKKEDEMSVVEPLKVFEEHAAEIKGLLGEINSLSDDLEKEEIKVFSEKDETVIEEPEEQINLHLSEEEEGHVVEVDEFSVVRDLSLLGAVDVPLEEDEPIEELSDDPVSDEIDAELEEEVKADSIEESEVEFTEIEEEEIDEELIQREEEAEEQTDVEENIELLPFADTPKTIEDDNNIIELPDKELTVAESVKEVIEEPIKEDIEEKPVDTVVSKPVIEYEKEEKKSRKGLWWLILIPLLLASIAFFVNEYLKHSKHVESNRRVEFIADSLAGIQRVQEIADSLDRLHLFELGDSVAEFLEEALIDPNEQVKDDIVKDVAVEPKQEKTAEQQKVATPGSPSISFSELSQKPRTYNEFITTEKMRAGSQLTRFARDHYGHPHFWVYIYEANKSKISNPDNIPAGIDIRIPRMDKRLVDPNNREALEYALQLQNQYLR